MQVEPPESEKVTILSLGAPATILGTPGVAGQILHFHLGIHDPLKNVFRQKLNHLNQRRSNFKPLAFCGYFAFCCSIRRGTNIRPPHSESPQQGAPHNI
jgi:hypothetical protein